ncbi:hypothetical protein HMPREF1531_02528 [Propionibacterium sp. oral taxon 192 str. F0372]|uniref:ABC transporter ATP-binding protein n=1 Tax=Propionibacterium sp. oral taxon 192 TaxID=671222 RepID=UPI000352885A|nr:ABC transporter ATP-binding protein [Propionibacterium sp. oral taxon 192]EPH00416.1 hypothetical protein HMPREF1531_02528 [Propionibacterium sp. oral taxon 192 str. F0372]
MPEQLRLSGVSFRYPGASRDALVEVEVVARPRRRISIMGNLGSGRSTLVQAMCGVVPSLTGGSMTGEVRYGRADLADHPVSTISEYIALVLQDPESQLLSRTVAEDVALGPRNRGLAVGEVLARVRAGLAAVGLSGSEGRATCELSGGEAQRLAIAGVLAMDPEVLCLDQATARLDSVGAAAVERVCTDLVGAGCCVVSVDGDPAVAARADELWVMSGGRVEIVPPLEMLGDADTCAARGIRPLPVAQLMTEVRARCIDASQPPPLMDVTGVVTWAAGLADGCPADVTRLPRGGEVVAVFEDVSFSYDGTRPVLCGLDLEIRAGQLLGLVGPNGSGKSTLVKMLNGLLRSTSGRVLLKGTDVARIDAGELARQVGFCFQIPSRQLFNPRVDREIGCALRHQGVPRKEVRRRVGEVMERLGIVELAGCNPLILDAAQQQLVALASALVHEPILLVVDEPTATQDWPGTRRIMELLEAERDRGVAVIMISHDEELLGWHADRVVRLKEGRVVADGAPGHVLDTQAVRVWRSLFPGAAPASDTAATAAALAKMAGGNR